MSEIQSYRTTQKNRKRGCNETMHIILHNKYNFDDNSL